VSWSGNKKFHHIGSTSTHFYMLLGFSVVVDSEVTVVNSLGSGIQWKNVLSIRHGSGACWFNLAKSVFMRCGDQLEGEQLSLVSLCTCSVIL
jgi:hypothetical protein